MGVEGKSLCILTPMYDGNAKSNWISSFAELVLNLAKYRIPFSYNFVWNESLIPRGRNRMADRFLKTTTDTHCVMIDSDIGFDTNEVLSMLEHDKDIIAVPCSKKSIRWDRIQKTIRDQVAREINQNLPAREFSNDEMVRLGGDFVMNFIPFESAGAQIYMNKLMEMRNLGTGLMMIKRETFDKYRLAYTDRWYQPKADAAEMPGQIFDYFRAGVNTETREYDSEDYCFCHDCRAIGLKVFLAPWVRTTHVGSHVFIGDLPTVAALTGEIG